MSISAIQKRRKTNEFVQQLAQKGIAPNNFELNKLLTEYFDVHTMGMPYYSPIKQIPYEASSKEDYNHNFSTFREDIETIFEADIEANNKAVAMQEYYDLEKSKVLNAIHKVGLRADNILQAIKTSNKVKQFVEVFDDMYDIEFYGNPKRNIPFSTCFIDLLQKCVYTEKMNAKVNKLSMADATITIEKTEMFETIKTEGTKESVLSDIIGDVYLLCGRTQTESEQTIELIIDLDQLMTFNTVLFRFMSARDMLCELSLSDDGINYTLVYDLSGCECLEWNFSDYTAQYIKIRCTKDEPDGVTNNSSNVEIFEYYYLLKNVSIAREEYNIQSMFVSKVIDFDDLTSTIRLDAEDMTFNHTRIDYFIGFDNGRDKVGWDHIPNHQDYELYMFQKSHKIANYHLPEYATSDGIYDMYAVMEIPRNVNKNSIKVTPGYNMWSVIRYNRTTGDLNDGFSLDGTSDFTEFISNCNKAQLFMDCENYDGFRLQSNVLYIFTQYVDLEHADALYNNFLKVMDSKCEIQYEQAQFRVFLNGYEVTAGDDDLYSFGLHIGVNKIQIAVYCPSDTATERLFYHNLNFKALTNNVFGFVPMRYTSNAILDKVVGQTYQYYTLRDNKVYVKCNPADLINSRLEDMGYFITYSALREDLTGYFEDNHLKFRIMAVLNSNDRNVSPRILNYRLTGR